MNVTSVIYLYAYMMMIVHNIMVVMMIDDDDDVIVSDWRENMIFFFISIKIGSPDFAMIEISISLFDLESTEMIV